MKIEKNKILIAKEKPNLVINSKLITFSLDPKLQGPLEDPLKIAFQRSKVGMNEDYERSCEIAINYCLFSLKKKLFTCLWFKDF